MSLDRVPPRSEVSGWSPENLAVFFKKSKLLGCDRVVLHHRISGERFVNLSENDLQKFPRQYSPMISKLSADIRKKSEKRGFPIFGKSKQQQQPETVPDVGGWAEDEFDDEEDDSDYEHPCSGDEDSDDYEPVDEDQDQKHLNQGENQDDDLDYEPPPSEPPDDFINKLPSVSIGDSDYIDSHVSSRGPPPTLCPRPPIASLAPHRTQETPRRDPSPNCRPRPSGKISSKPVPQQLPPQIFRGNKPGRDPASNSPIRGPQGNTGERPPTNSWSRPPQDIPATQSWTRPPALPPTSVSVSRSNSAARPPPNRFEGRREQQPVPDETQKHNTFPLHNKNPRSGLPSVRHTDSLPPSLPSAAALKPYPGFVPAPERASIRPPPPAAFNSHQDLNPAWYVGRVTRGQADATLQQLRKDGAYVVRDSTKQSAGQPYTLMVFYQDKVYNIQIQLQNQSYVLGTGLKVQEPFSSVPEIIAHYSHSPLLLIDAKNRGSGQQNQCLLSDPVGHHLHS